ncbi:protoheme IX farnesyltransferase [Candidatus Caldarchaeum subterraneum]|uniref:Protoheme IX farnesyltransferase n=1 Tax=Caldiarchaeum subterraneum TaxID=311458 RepID=E6N960_CALS0|nr:protoheme IX farnesyltransferase [Candidatus Caldarchaeum subterraneum]BAJ48875.1 protoheme IX farnesyltransferase [Candidatus Caldarchaeum subterraneum]BAJ51496.1 protoheme IX farnesyltransferase [Candidatus Caldarchaeum subterraneum]
MSWRDFLNLTKPKITLLNIFAASASFLSAEGSPANMIHLLLAGYLSVGGASALNHFLDADIDSRMRRTSGRPIPAGRIRPRTAALLGSIMVAAAVLYSYVMYNPLTAIFILSGALVYVFVYTVWLKRRTVWNIVIGGVAGSFAPLAGWSAAGREIEALPLFMALLVFLWTPGHFWALASRAVKDYSAAGVPMLPVVYGVQTTSIATLVSNVIAVAAALLMATLVSNPLLYLVIAAPFSAWLLIESIKPCIKYSPSAAWRAFKISSPWLFIIFAAIAASTAL